MKRPDRKNPTEKHAARWVAALFSVFVSGGGFGFALGIWASDPVSRPVIEASIPNYVSVGNVEHPSDGLPVTVYRSETALKNFTFEEPDVPDVPEDAHIAAAPRSPVKPGPSSIDLESDSLSLPRTQDREPQQTASAALARPPRGRAVQSDARWIRHAVPIDVDYTKPMIAVIIDDLGIDQPRTRTTIALPGPLTLSFIPYGYNLRDLVADAKTRRHEIMLHLPMEPRNPDIDPGPNALLVGLSEDERRRRLSWAMEQFDDYVGVNNHMGSKFTAWANGMRPVLERLKQDGMLFVDSITTQDTVGYRMARKIGVPNATRDVFLDHDMRPEAIAAALAKTERIAQKRGIAVAIGHPHDATVDELRRWIPSLAEKGIQLVPITTIVRVSYPNG